MGLKRTSANISLSHLLLIFLIEIQTDTESKSSWIVSQAEKKKQHAGEMENYQLARLPKSICV